MKATGIQVNLRREYTAIQVQKIQAGPLDAGSVGLPFWVPQATALSDTEYAKRMSSAKKKWRVYIPALFASRLFGIILYWNQISVSGSFFNWKMLGKDGYEVRSNG